MNIPPADNKIASYFEPGTNDFPGAHVQFNTYDLSAAGYDMSFILPAVGVANTHVDKISTPDTINIQEIVVAGAMRGEGFGKMLLGWALEDAKDKGLLKADIHIINSFVIGSIRGLLGERRIDSVSYIKKRSGINIFSLPLQDVEASTDRISAEEAERYIETEKSAGARPAVRAAILL